MLLLSDALVPSGGGALALSGGGALVPSGGGGALVLSGGEFSLGVLPGDRSLAVFGLPLAAPCEPSTLGECGGSSGGYGAQRTRRNLVFIGTLKRLFS